MRPGIDYIGIATAFFCHDGEGNFLFHKRSQNCRDEQGSWDCGGGKLEFGEDVEVGMWRELSEEYGCGGVIDDILPPTSFFGEVNGERRHWLVLPFIVRVDRNDVKIGEPESMDELSWFSLGNLPDTLHPGARHEISIYRDTFNKYRLNN